MSKPAIKSKDLMQIKEAIRKIDDCTVACINFEKRFESMKYKELIERVESLEDYKNMLTVSGLDELVVRVDNMRIFFSKVESYWDPLVNKVADHKAAINDLRIQVTLLLLMGCID